MATTPIPLVVPFREQLLGPIGLEFDQLTDHINQNFSSPSAPTSLVLQYTEFTEEPMKSELQALIPQINAGFTAVAGSSVASPVVLRNAEQIPEPYLYQCLYMITGLNLGLAALYP